MKKPKWHAKVFSLIVVLAFALGLVPLAPVASDITITFDFYAYPTFAKVGQTVCFQGTTHGGKPSCDWEWHFGDGNTNCCSKSTCHQYWSPGTYTVSVKIDCGGGPPNWVTKEDYITVEEGLWQGDQLALRAGSRSFWGWDRLCGLRWTFAHRAWIHAT